MESLNQFYHRLRDQVASMTPGSRIIAGLLVLIAAISLGYLCVYPFVDSQQATPQQNLASGVGAAESADPMEEAIHGDKIWYFPDTRNLLHNTAKEKVLAKEITDFFTDVEQAKVKLNSREEIRRGRSHQCLIASICVKMKSGKKLSRDSGTMICNYVAEAAGRAPADVKVFDPSHRISFRGSRDDETMAAGHDALADRKAVEQECREKIRRLLNFIPRLTVVVSAQRGWSEKDTSSNNDRDENGSADKSSAMTCNMPRHLPVARHDHSAAKKTPVTATGQYDDARDPYQSDGMAAVPMRVAIRVPGSYFEKLCDDQNRSQDGFSPSRSGQADRRAIEAREIERIKQLAASVLPAVEGAGDRAQWITVVPFHDSAPAERIRQAETPTEATWYADYAIALGLVVLAVVLWFALRTFWRRVPLEANDQNKVETNSDLSKSLGVAISRHDDASGIELDGQLARRLIERHRAANEPSARTPFGLLHKTDSQRIARILAGELPQTIALVLSHLPQRQAGDVLVCLSAEVQVDVIRRLVHLEQTDPEVLREIEATLAARLAEQVPMQSHRVAGLEAVGGILEASRQTVGRTILGNLAASDQQLAAEFESYVAPETNAVSFENLAQLDVQSRQRLCAVADEQLLGLALVGASDMVTDRLLEGLPSEKAEALRRSLERLQPTRLSDVDLAREQLIELARSLDAEPSAAAA